MPISNINTAPTSNRPETTSSTPTTAALFLVLIILMPFLAPLLIPLLLFTLPTGEENNA